jgi:hypothetical protein
VNCRRILGELFRALLSRSLRSGLWEPVGSATAITTYVTECWIGQTVDCAWHPISRVLSSATFEKRPPRVMAVLFGNRLSRIDSRYRGWGRGRTGGSRLGSSVGRGPAGSLSPLLLSPALENVFPFTVMSSIK